MKLKMNQAATKIQSMRRRVISRRRMIKEKVMKRLRHDQSVRTNFMINIVRTLYVIFILLPVTSLLLLFLSLLLSVAFSLSLSLSLSLCIYLCLSASVSPSPSTTLIKFLSLDLSPLLLSSICLFTSSLPLTVSSLLHHRFDVKSN